LARETIESMLFSAATGVHSIRLAVGEVGRRTRVTSRAKTSLTGVPVEPVTTGEAGN
jgi:hypothetical protein